MVNASPSASNSMELPATPSPAPVVPGVPQGQPPTGSSPATMPIANRGQEAGGLALLSVAVKLLDKSFSRLGVGTEAGRDVLTCLNKLAKHVPAGQTPPGVEQNAMQNTMDQNKQMQTMLPLLRQQAAAGGAGGGAPPPTPPTPQAAAA